MPPSYYQEASYNKSESDSTPEEKKKDPLSVKTIRTTPRQREESITKTAELLRVENESLKNEIVQLREMIADLRKQLNSTCQHGASAEQARDGGGISRDVTYNPYHTFQIGFSINSQL
ncbi:hypothetical protein KIN20_032166 [Parelaphostrongylus tenuis]|uniref:Uncharacterized protein n=1 Tax=Parelaphostrongylus tenuis TaxID=148309 RepID=A0AAD5R6K6_PARTN|nr:hypothetical protein KIN20_032166 [Parelaphostrongylus tenuis]